MLVQCTLKSGIYFVSVSDTDCTCSPYNPGTLGSANYTESLSKLSSWSVVIGDLGQA